MSYGILKFKLPEEQTEFNEALNGGKFQSVVWDMAEFFRSKLKYTELSEDEQKAFEEARSKLYELLADRGLDL